MDKVAAPTGLLDAKLTTTRENAKLLGVFLDSYAVFFEKKM